MKLEDRHSGKINVGILVICFVVIFLVFWYGYEKVYLGVSDIDCFQNTAAEITTDLIRSDEVIVQKMHVYREISGISLFFATHGNSITEGKINVKILDVDGNSQIDTEVEAKKIKDNQYLFIDFGEQSLEPADNAYYIRLEFQDIDDQTISLWLSSLSNEETERVIINGSESDYHLVMKQAIPEHDMFFYVFCILICITIAACMIAYILIYLYKKEVHVVYAVAGVLLGIVYMVMIPMFSVPDEPTHFYKAYEISNKILGVECEDNKLFMRADDAEYKYKTEGLTREYYNQCYTQFTNVFTDNDNIVNTKNGHLKAYSYFYTASSVGLSVGRLLHFGPAFSFLMGRLFNCICFTLVTAYAIKRIPFGKTILFIWALLPMTLQQIASYSYDMIILALSILVICLSVYITYSDISKVKNREWIILFLATLLLVPAKSFALLPICVLPFMIYFTKRNIKNKKLNYYFATMLIGIVLMVLFVKLTTNVTNTSNYIGWAQEEGHTIVEFIKNPVSLFVMIGNTLYHKADFFLGTLLGNSLGWFEINMPMVVVLPFFIMLILAGMKKSDEKMYLTTGVKVFFSVLAFLGIGFACAGMLFSWTPKSYDLIMGIQGRYFLPFIPLLFLAIRGKRIAVERSLDNELMMFSILTQIFVLVCVFVRVA